MYKVDLILKKIIIIYKMHNNSDRYRTDRKLIIKHILKIKSIIKNLQTKMSGRYTKCKCDRLDSKR